MTYDLYLVGGLDAERLRAALAVIFSVPAASVDVSGQDAPDRRWEAPVLCGYSAGSGDISGWLDISLRDEVVRRPPVEEVGRRLADALSEPVLYAAFAEFPESAFWLAVPGGPRTRARVLDGDDEDAPSLTIDAIERSVPQLPRIRVA